MKGGLPYHPPASPLWGFQVFTRGKKGRAGAFAPCHSLVLIHSTRIPLESSACGHAVKQEPRAEAMESGPGEPQSDSFLTKRGHSAQTDTPGQHEEGGIGKENATIPEKTIVTDYHCPGFHLPTTHV